MIATVYEFEKFTFFKKKLCHITQTRIVFCDNFFVPGFFLLSAKPLFSNHKCLSWIDEIVLVQRIKLFVTTFKKEVRDFQLTFPVSFQCLLGRLFPLCQDNNLNR